MNAYSTRYSELSDAEVNALYQYDSWSELSSEERLDALQELENRTAAEAGNAPCEVVTQKMNGASYGYYQNGVITVNQDLVSSGCFSVTYEDGTTDQFFTEDANAQLMDTIHHENYHAYQDAVIHSSLAHADSHEIELWRANDENYISGDTPLYRIQSLERTAFDHGETQTCSAFSAIEAEHGTDRGYQEYLEAIQENSYENALSEAQEQYEDAHIQETLDQEMLDAYHETHAGISEEVYDDADFGTDVLEAEL